jgi:hypothetical protein
MAATIDVNQLITNMKTAANAVLQQDIANIEGYSERQLQAIAMQGAWIANGSATGELSADLRDFFLNNLQDLVTNFAKTLAGLVIVTVEKVWNALVNVLWTAIGQAINTALPIPLYTG